MRSSTKIFIGFCATVAVVVFGYNKIEDALIMGQKFSPIVPGKINIVGITPKGYHVIVSNEVAQLVESQGGFEANEGSGDESGGDSDSGGSVKKKISIKDMMGVLQGNSKSLSDFVMAMNDMSENDLPPTRVVWTKDDIEKALAGDKTLVAKLERDLNVHLDGAPLDTVDVQSILNGIVIQTPVQVTVNMAGVPKVVVGSVLSAYKPTLVKAVEADFSQKANVTNTMIAGYYKQEAETTLAHPKYKDNVRQYLLNEISDKRAKDLVQFPQEILGTAFVVVSDKFMDNASYSTYPSTNGKPLYDLNISLNDEGRRRLWQYSRQRVGDQILLTSEGVGIAVARIQHPLSGGVVTITQMKDQTLLDDLIATLKESKQDKVARN